jgi:L-alanine-DL-glutamate epimerase-like enolase superfamily enzyme
MLAKYDVHWFEEPLIPDKLEDYVSLRRLSPVKIWGRGSDPQAIVHAVALIERGRHAPKWTPAGLEGPEALSTNR